MFDYQTSKHAHFDAACRAFTRVHNVEEVAAAIGMRRPQVLRNKLNPDQPHQLTVPDIIAITDYTEDACLLDGLLAQINCLPAVPRNEAKPGNLSLCTLQATASVGALAAEAVSPGHMTAARRTAILDQANAAIRNLSLITLSIEARLHTAPMMAAAIDVVTAMMPAVS
ncbi:phage regulatory CII family protein [Edwardsiella tarda]|uniref:phage regulatory CII family protein n=1 Tax=Edwardsiella tarda TaxID=636 RepID=UPI0002F00B22|nr:phage regulatory CII family protein [Edwardsiella tarda]